MTKTGKIREVKNIDSLFLRVFDKFPQLSDVQKEQIRNQLMQSYGEKAFKGNLEMVSAIFHDSSVSKGNKWIINTKLESGMAGKMESTYEYKDKTDSYIQIIGDSKISTDNKDAYIESNGMPLKFDLNGIMNSDIKINKYSGWILDARITQSIKGTAYVKDNPKMPGGMTMPMIINNEMTITEK